MFLSRLSVRRPVLMTMVVGMFVVFGLVAWPRMPVELLPQVNIPYLLVRVVYPGAGPLDVESGILLPLEESLSRINNLETLRTSAVPDAGLAVLELDMGTDIEGATDEVRARLEELDAELPDGARRPVVQAINLNAAPVMQLAITADRPMDRLTKWVEEHLEERLSRVEGVASVEAVGDRPREIHVEVDQARLLAHHLTLAHVVEAVRAGGTDVPAGTVSEGNRTASVRLRNAFRSAEDIRAVALKAPTGELIPLGAVAEVSEAMAPETTRARIDGHAAIGLSVYKRAEANTAALGRRLQRELTQLRAEAGEDIEIRLVHDASESIRVSIRDLVATLGLCILLTAVILWFFLHDWRGTLVVALSIPCSLVGSLTFVYLAGFTINYMTLMGLAITVGTLVDASIVVLESISSRVREGVDPAEAADQGTGRVFLGVVGSTVTNILVFTPVAFMEGIVGQFFEQFALTVTFSMLLALLTSLTLTPMLASLLYRRPPKLRPGPLAIAWDRGFAWVRLRYRHTVRWALGHRRATLAALGAVFAASLVLLGPVVSLGWFENPDQGFFVLRLTLPRGSDLEVTERAVHRTEQVLLAHPEVDRAYSEIGRYATLFGSVDARNRAEMHVALRDHPGRPPTLAVMQQLRRDLALAVPGAELLLKELGGGETAIRDDFLVELFGPDPDRLAALADEVMAIFESLPNVSDTSTQGRELAPEIRVTPFPDRVAAAGLKPAEVGMLLRAAVEGDTEARARIGDDHVPVRIRLQHQDREDLAAVAATTIQTAGGAQVPLRELARVQEVTAPATIYRQAGQRRMVVRANLAWGAIADTTAQLEEAIAKLDIEPPYRIRIGGEEEQRTEATAEIRDALLLAIVLTWMLLAGLLESFVHPFTILSTVPLAIVGVLTALAVTGVDLDIFGLMALVMLVGIVVNNAILMLEETRHLRREGASLAEALEEGAMRRLRPILMTTLSTLAGMTPLALALGAGAEIRQAMALVSIGGVGVSSVLILVACPVLYHLVESARSQLGRR